MPVFTARPHAALLLSCILCGGLHSTRDAHAQDAQDGGTAAAAGASASPRLDIWEYYVSGNSVLEPEVIAQACAPYLGPARTPEDVDAARAALETLYRERGYRTVGVSIPQQTVKGGVVRLEVVENRVGQLAVV